MSIPVDVADLAQTLEGFGAGYLLTASETGTVKAVNAAPTLEDGVLVVRTPGRGSLANAAAHPSVTLLFPPLEAPGYTLIVDGLAEALVDDLRVTPTGAVLHRPVS